LPSDPNLLDASRFAGNYVMDHYPRKSIEKLAELMRPAAVKATGPGTIQVETEDNGKNRLLGNGSPVVSRER